MLRVLTLIAALALAAPALAQSVDQPALDRLQARISRGELANVHSVIVVQHGKTIAEWYFAGIDERRGEPLGKVAFTAGTQHDVRSVSKSVVSMLFGIAISEGAIKSLDEPVLNYFPEYPDLKTPERMKIRIRDILSMGSGLKWDEDSIPYTDPRNSEIAMDMAPDRYRFVLEQEIVTAPGAAFRYSGGDVALAGAILARATKTPLEDYARAKLFAPMGITNFAWDKDAKGVPFAASGLRLEPRDMAKLGVMMLHGGEWNGRLVVPAAWAKDSTSPHNQVAPDPDCGMRYGYYWWLDQGCRATPRAPAFAAIGNGGQRIMVVPGRDLVIVITAGNYSIPAQGPVTLGVLAGVLEAVK